MMNFDEMVAERNRQLIKLAKRRDMYVKAFIASTGCSPDDVLITERHFKDGTITHSFEHKESDIGKLMVRAEELMKICVEQKRKIEILERRLIAIEEI